jgi:hypothetical protein
MADPVAVNDASAVVRYGMGLLHGCGGSVNVDSGAWVCWKEVEFPNKVTNCVTVSVVLGANAKEVVNAQYDTHMLPVSS